MKKEEDTRQDLTMPFLGHLEELRRRLITSLVAIGCGFVLSFAFSHRIIGWLSKPLGSQLVFLSPAEAFWATLRVSFFFGIFLAVPVVLYQLWKFTVPGLYPRERRYALPFVLVASLFFLLGLAFCYFIVLPFALKFLITYGVEMGLRPQIAIGQYLGFVLWFLLAFGLVFELPLIITVLARIGIVTPEALARRRPYAILAAFVIAALFTPTPDVFNQALMAIPIILLYEVGILSARLLGKKRKEA